MKALALLFLTCASLCGCATTAGTSTNLAFPSEQSIGLEETAAIRYLLTNH